MYKFLTKNGQTLAFGLGVLITVIFLGGVLSGSSEFAMMSKEDQAQTGIFNFGLASSIFLIIVAVILLLGFGLWHIATDLKGSVKGLIGFGILLAVFFITYATASTEVTPYIQGAIDKFQENGSIFTDNNLKFISGGISTAGVLVAVAALAFVFSEVRNFFK
jgi:hypothetical protein